MGNVIQKKAAEEKIIEDLRSTVVDAAARASLPGGEIWGAAATRLGPTLTVHGLVSGKLAAARAEAAPLVATVVAKNVAADNLVKRISDEVWNDVGRPQSDPLYELLFPDGSSVYTDGDPEDQPDLMVLLAELMEANLHPKLAPASAADKGRQLRASADELAQAVRAAAPSVAKVKLYEKVQLAVARSGQVALSNLKRHLKAEGLSEADVHAVIPDRPRDYGTKPAGPTVVVDPNNPT